MFRLTRFLRATTSALAIVLAIACPASAQNRQCRDGDPVSMSGTIFHILKTNKGVGISTLNRGETTGTCLVNDIIFDGTPPETCVRGADFSIKGKAIATWRVVATSLECRPGPSFMVFFDHGQTTLPSEALAVIDVGANAIRSTGARFVWVIGYADASEHENMPKGFPISRAESVKAALASKGLAPDSIVVMTSDRSEMPVQTGPGVKEPLNRRVFVRIIK